MVPPLLLDLFAISSFSLFVGFLISDSLLNAGFFVVIESFCSFDVAKIRERISFKSFSELRTFLIVGGNSVGFVYRFVFVENVSPVGIFDVRNGVALCSCRIVTGSSF